MSEDLRPLPPGDRVRHVVVTFPVPDGALRALADQLGPGHVVRDIQAPGPPPHVVLCPSTSPQAIQRLSAEFPGAAVIVVEVDEWFGGPVTRAMNAGASGYYIAASPAALGEYLRSSLVEDDALEAPADGLDSVSAPDAPALRASDPLDEIPMMPALDDADGHAGERAGIEAMPTRPPGHPRHS